MYKSFQSAKNAIQPSSLPFTGNEVYWWHQKNMPYHVKERYFSTTMRFNLPKLFNGLVDKIELTA